MRAGGSGTRRAGGRGGGEWAADEVGVREEEDKGEEKRILKYKLNLLKEKAIKK
jgi:hypothetical protein